MLEYLQVLVVNEGTQSNTSTRFAYTYIIVRVILFIVSAFTIFYL